MTIEIAKKIILDIQWKKRSKVYFNVVVEYVTEQHEKGEGRFATREITTKIFVKRALSLLEDKGLACKISKDTWEFPKHGQRIFGKGKQWVYLYYYDTYKQQALQQGRNAWRCKIGYAENTPEKTIEAQKRAAPEKPTIALLFRTHNCKVLEKVIHKSLELRGKRLNDTGNEWFLTNPDEVAKFYNDLQDALLHFAAE